VDDLVVVDPWSRAVTLSGTRWRDHVLHRHPELAPYRELVGVALTEPHVVNRDRYYSDREGFYRRRLPSGSLSHLYLKVVVGFDRPRFDPGGVGFVITVFPTPEVHPDEVRLWP